MQRTLTFCEFNSIPLNREAITVTSLCVITTIGDSLQPSMKGYYLKYLPLVRLLTFPSLPHPCTPNTNYSSFAPPTLWAPLSKFQHPSKTHNLGEDTPMGRGSPKCTSHSLNSPRCFPARAVPAAPRGASRSSFPFTVLPVCRVSPPKGTEFHRKTPSCGSGVGCGAQGPQMASLLLLWSH